LEGLEGGVPGLFLVSRGNKGVTGEWLVSRGNKGVRGEMRAKFADGVSKWEENPREFNAEAQRAQRKEEEKRGRGMVICLD
jgi:hypothetical protein